MTQDGRIYVLSNIVLTSHDTPSIQLVLSLVIISGGQSQQDTIL
jgi:hypothetical protein